MKHKLEGREDELNYKNINYEKDAALMKQQIKFAEAKAAEMQTQYERTVQRYEDRIKILELDANTPLTDRVDIVMYDSFAQPQADHVEVAALVANPLAGRVVVYTWNFHPDLIRAAYKSGAHGYLSKTLPARELVEALDKVIGK